MSCQQPRILLLARSFPPSENIASVRTKAIAKHLSRLGWRVTVVTVDQRYLVRAGDSAATPRFLEAEQIEVIGTEHRWGSLVPGFVKVSPLAGSRVVRGLARRIGRFLDVDSGYGWLSPVLRACDRIRPGDTDVILASGPPYASFVAAEALARRLRCPFVLDYRDPWTVTRYAMRKHRARTARAERHLVLQCSLVSTVSSSLAEAFRQSFGVDGKVFVLSNGFDPEDLEGIRPAYFGHFAVVYAGSFDPPARTVTPVLNAISALRAGSASRKAWFHYYGRESKHVLDEARRIGVVDLVVDHGLVSRGEALSAVRGADAVAVVASVRQDSQFDGRGIVTGKVFEALGLERPILLVAPEGSDAASVVEGSGAGKRFSAQDHDGMASFLETLRSGCWPADCSRIGAYAWPSLARGLDARLREAAFHT